MHQKKMKILTIIFMFSVVNLTAQNLIPNPSFEHKKRCPKKLSMTRLLKHWYSPTQATPDYYNKCSKKNNGIPLNYSGSQEPYEGDGYAGIIVDIISLDSTTEKPPIYREYIQCKLLNSLEYNKKYSIQMFVSLADKSWYTNNKIQVNFSKTELKQDFYFTPKRAFNLNDLEMIENFGDKDWYKLEGEYLAKGGERYLTIGNFEYYSEGILRNLDFLDKESHPYIYLYLDNISLVLKKEVKQVIELDSLIKNENLTGDNKNTSTIGEDKIKDIQNSKSILDEININEKIIFEDITFQLGKSELLKISYPILDSLLISLTENTKIELEIIGHTDNIGDRKSNQKLSVERAKTVYSYLIAKGVSEERLSYKGMGNSVPIDTNKTEEGRSKNRRVEFKILRK